MGAPRPVANPFRDRLAEIRKQSGDSNPHSKSGGEASSEGSGDMSEGEDQQPRKGCLSRLFKGGTAAAVFIAAVIYVFLR